MSVKVEQVVQAYVATRDEIAAIKKRQKEELTALEEVQETRARWLHKQLDEVGTDSMKTAHGTVFKKKTERVSMGDWETFLGYVTTNQAWELLNKAVNKTEALERMGEDRDTTQVPGVKYSAEIEIGVRRS